MGTIYIEPIHMEGYGGDLGGHKSKNISFIVCMPLKNIHPHDFLNSNLLSFSFPLLLFQMFTATAIIGLVSKLLKPLGQPLFFCQLLGGILIGPSLLGSSSKVMEIIFPLRGFMMLDPIASLGIMFNLFLMGVQVDPRIVKKIDRTAIIIGLSTFALPMITSNCLAFLLMPFVDEDEIAISLPIIARIESVLSLPMIGYFLIELKIVNTELGRVALSSSAVGNICGIVVYLASQTWNRSGEIEENMLVLLANVVVLSFIFLVIRPLILWMLRRNSEGPLRQDHLIVLFLAVIISGLWGISVGLKAVFGPFVLGLSLPAGPPLGSTLAEKLGPTISWVLMPMYFAKIGLLIDVFAMPFKHYFIVSCIVFTSATGKFAGAFLSSIRCQMPKRDAIVLGLVMTFQGIFELVFFKLMRDNKRLDKGSFAIMCILLLLKIGFATPIIRRLYDPSRRYTVYGRRTVMHSKPNNELRMLVCIHEQEDVPTAINLIEALNPTKQSPIAVTMLHFIELVGRTEPLLISHILPKGIQSHEASASEHIINAFRHLENSSSGTMTLLPYTSISPPETMHADVCTIALERGACLAIVPFQKKLDAKGYVQSTTKAAKITNRNLFDRPLSPCSIGLLIDRGVLKTSTSSLNSWSSYRVAVLFLGGADDREALAIGARVAGCPNISLTIIRLLNGNDTSLDADWSLDNEIVSKFRSKMEENYHVTYVEEVVKDGAGTVGVIRSMQNQYQLVILGRRHDRVSPLISGLSFWDEQQELGPIGDVFASSDFIGNTTILVVEQQTKAGKGSVKYRGGIFTSPDTLEF